MKHSLATAVRCAVIHDDEFILIAIDVLVLDATDAILNE
jgi:hypothetical protein